mmetsp:Transcript_24989/g.57066  ORF Transcript_24989/g.57066 Transcript_24989/m.57066 type:complete len:578 (+) Transcript_24989:23-1756(+)
MDQSKDGSLTLEEIVAAMTVDSKSSICQDNAFLQMKYSIFAYSFMKSLGHDTDTVGLTVDVFVASAASLGVSADQAEEVFRHIDDSEDGYATVEEFCRAFTMDNSGLDPHLVVNTKYTLLMQIFRQASHGRKIRLGFEDFTSILCVQFGMLKEVAVALFDEFDPNKTGWVNLVDMCHKLSLTHKDKNILAMQEKALSAVFGLLDVDGSKDLDVAEFTEALGKLGIRRYDARSLFALLDTNRSNSVSADEFLQGLLTIDQEQVDASSDIRRSVFMAALQSVSVGADSTLSMHDFALALRQIGINPQIAESFVTEATGQPTNQLSVAEFSRMLAADSSNPYHLPLQKACLRMAFAELLKLSGNTGESQLNKAAFIDSMAPFGASRQESAELFDRVDRNKDGAIDLPEFMFTFTTLGMQVADPRTLVTVKYSLLKTVFQSLNSDQDKVLSAAEWRDAMVDLGLGPEEATRMFKEFDAAGGGEVKEGEFCHSLALGGQGWKAKGELLRRAYFNTLKAVSRRLCTICRANPDAVVHMEKCTTMLVEVGIREKHARAALCAVEAQQPTATTALAIISQLLQLQ